ncbi:MAG: hypothetical protein E2O93_03150 [Alphaproteobacteria bacterium]|nr:MAG: hypothetical protein E2O93_03150 [Alphaproteobacteria bacterium]
MDYADILLLRGAERLLIVAVAGLCIWLGYRLFSIVPTDLQGKGEFKALSFSLAVSKVGPGVFFAAFGAFILYQAVTNAFEQTLPAGSQTTSVVRQGGFGAPAEKSQARGGQQVVALKYLGGSSVTKADLTCGIDQISFLNCAAGIVAAKAPSAVGETIDGAIEAGKRGILFALWQEEWGTPGTNEAAWPADVKDILQRRSLVCEAEISGLTGR